MRFYMFEGSPEELSKVLPTLDVTLGESHVPALKTMGTDELKSDKHWVTNEEARTILTRRPLSGPVLKMLQALCTAGVRRLTSDELKKVTAQNADEFRGMLGAFGRRVSHTASENAQFFDRRWDHQLAQFSWSLPESVRQVMRELKMGS